MKGDGGPNAPTQDEEGPGRLRRADVTPGGAVAASRSIPPAVIAASAIAIVVAILSSWAMAGRTQDSLLIALVAFGGAGLVAWLAATHPVAAFGVLFLLSSVSRTTLDLPIGRMRIEQPAIMAVLLLLALTGAISGLRSLPRLVWGVAGAFCVYLVALAISSAFIAPDPATSLRLVLWQTISMLGAVAAFLIVRRRAEASIDGLALGGATVGALGLGLATVFLVAGPAVAAGVQEAYGELPRVYALSWEANLYASFLVGCAPFALELLRTGRRWFGIAAVALTFIGIPLGGTRGAYLGLAAATFVYVAIVGLRERSLRQLVPVGAIAAMGLIVGVGGSSVLLPNILERAGGPAVSAVVSPLPSTVMPGITALPSTGQPSVTLAPTSSPTPIPTFPPPADTIDFRLQRVPPALADLGTSPIVGLGAASFGQRHADPSQRGAPDHIAILVLAAAYESGVVGATALALGFVLILLGLWRSSGRPRVTGPEAAFAASIVGLLVAFQATNALHFASNWLIVGAAAALIASTGNEGGRRPEPH